MSRTAAVLIPTFVFVLSISLTGAQEPQQLNGNQTINRQQLEQQSRQFAVHELARIVRGYEVAPVRLDLNGKDPVLVGLGSYLVNVQGGCNDCHTNPPFAEGGDPFQGQPQQINTAAYLAGGVTFGPFTSRNLTPTADTGLPGGLTYQQFRRTMRTGVDLKNAHPDISPLLQVMPWPLYQELTERDLRAMYEYLRAIPHAEPGAPE